MFTVTDHVQHGDQQSVYPPPERDGYVSPHRVFVCSKHLPEGTVIFSLNSSEWMFFNAEVECIL